ncbi:MAG: hypothetical protein H7308_12545 [Chthonomonadaceae bacterium]|nr:hypothetical protein [Chthonomonadaceae bacterium]
MTLESVFPDSTPYGLVTQKPGKSVAGGQCREWITLLTDPTVKVFVPAIAYYEIRREMLWVNKEAIIRPNTFLLRLRDSSFP